MNFKIRNLGNNIRKNEIRYLENRNLKNSDISSCYPLKINVSNHNKCWLIKKNVPTNINILKS